MEPGTTTKSKSSESDIQNAIIAWFTAIKLSILELGSRLAMHTHLNSAIVVFYSKDDIELSKKMDEFIHITLRQLHK